MKFSINKNDIRNVLSKLQGLTGRKTNLAITETVLIKASDASITLIATDLETGLEGSYPAAVESEGLIAINAKKLYEIVKDFPHGEIHFNETEKRWIEIGNQNIEYHIVGMDPDDFPDTPQIEDVVFFEIDSAALKRMIEKTVIISGAADDKRAHINGIYFERVLDDDEKSVKMVSTDGSRLSVAEYRYDKDSELPPGPSIIIPKKGLNEVAKFLGSEGAVQIGFKDNHFIIKRDVEKIIIRLLEGDFPKYNDIIVKGDGHLIKIDRQLFLMMLKRMSILSSDTYKGVIFNFGEGRLLVTATNPDIGESKEEMPIEFEGDTVEVAFNPKYFIETLNVLEDDIAVLNIIDERRPCLVEGENDKSYLSVVMPMRI
ncbi:DNA polymerase III subunit beta [Desulfonema magnum]|uniref:Beta sliding clamp n=1 Tax=Desulfonema magnum TaxID=45655 RepID=A0A975GKF0_9BACT|nr:DNA polymerase III subunit beta [Desulfonema magnum]QTA84641.1 Beta sliding clamp [Desulfonema magnum]